MIYFLTLHFHVHIDPFNRKPLTSDMLVPQPELKQRIEAWLHEKGVF